MYAQDIGVRYHLPMMTVLLVPSVTYRKGACELLKRSNCYPVRLRLHLAFASASELAG